MGCCIFKYQTPDITTFDNYEDDNDLLQHPSPHPNKIIEYDSNLLDLIHNIETAFYQPRTTLIFMTICQYFAKLCDYCIHKYRNFNTPPANTLLNYIQHLHHTTRLDTNIHYQYTHFDPFNGYLYINDTFTLDDAYSLLLNIYYTNVIHKILAIYSHHSNITDQYIVSSLSRIIDNNMLL